MKTLFFSILFLISNSLYSQGLLHPQRTCSESQYSVVFDLSSSAQLSNGTLLNSLKLGMWGKENVPYSFFVGLKDEVQMKTGKSLIKDEYQLNKIPFAEFGLKVFRSEKFIHRIYTQVGVTSNKPIYLGWESGYLLENMILLKSFIQSNSESTQLGLGISVSF